MSMFSLQARRSTLGAAVLNNCIYAVGGFDGNSGLNSVEFLNLDPAQQETEGCESVPPLEWRYAASMTTRRSSVGVGVLDGFIYVVNEESYKFINVRNIYHCFLCAAIRELTTDYI